jgi:hypothetical protein
MTEFGRAARFAALFVLLPISIGAQKPVIRMEGGVFRVSGWTGAADCASVFKLYAGEGDVPPLLGTCSVENDKISFRPRYPIGPGMRVRAVFHPPGNAPVEAEFHTPDAAPKTPTTIVSNVYPSTSVLPENQLKLYVCFSAPMQKGDAWRHIRLLDAQGRPVDLPFLELDQELWNPEGTRLTVLFDPGRIKRGVRPLEESGPSIEAGKSYTLAVDSSWLDGNGAPLASEFRKQFRVGPADRDPIDPAKWRISAPRAGSLEPLVLDFPESLDYALLQRLLTVKGSEGAVAGTIHLTKEETEWQFVPQRPWQSGGYTVEVQTTLEDLAGNRVGRAFDVDTFDPITRTPARDTVSLAFRISQK